MIGYAPRYPEELHNIITEGMIEKKKTIGCPQNSYLGQIERDARVKLLRILN